MPEYKLIYFNARGRAELSRWIMAYGDINYTDERIERADWPARKSTIPGGKVPVLMVDDKPLPQSLAIARYLAKQAGLIPSDDLDAAYCDALADTLSEMMAEAYKILFAKIDEDEKKKKYKDDLYPNIISPLLHRLDKRLADREWFAGGKITWADLMLGLVFQGLRKKQPTMLKEFSSVENHVNKVVALPKIKQWIDSQPETPF
ncbi:hematopoietic prostaglandin D synthase-like [Homarus americanus]|nr:hematopoietic prostaglandin D synthase-like [Homarus americanus]